jgi:protein ImuA
LKSDRVIYLEAGDEKTVPACFEEGLRHSGLGAVVAEVDRGRARHHGDQGERPQLCSAGQGAREGAGLAAIDSL